MFHCWSWYFYEIEDRKESNTMAPLPANLEFQFTWHAPGNGFKIEMSVPVKNASGKMCYFLGTSGGTNTHTKIMLFFKIRIRATIVFFFVFTKTEKK